MKLAADQQAKITHVMAEITKQTKWGTQTVITFTPHNREPAFIKFTKPIDQGECSSDVGRIGVEQVIELCIRSRKVFSK